MDSRIVGLLVRIPRELRRRVKVVAAEHEITINELVVAALNAHLSSGAVKS